jgi:hypothetical protein
MSQQDFALFKPGQELTIAPEMLGVAKQQLGNEAARAMASYKPNPLGKHEYVTEQDADVDFKFTLVTTNGWTFPLVINQRDWKSGEPSKCFLVEFAPGATHFNDDGLANAIIDNEAALRLMEDGDITLSQNTKKELKHNQGFFLTEVCDINGEPIEPSPTAVLDPKTLRTRYIDSQLRTGLGEEAEIGKKWSSAANHRNPAALDDGELLGVFR